MSVKRPFNGREKYANLFLRCPIHSKQSLNAPATLMNKLDVMSHGIILKVAEIDKK